MIQVQPLARSEQSSSWRNLKAVYVFGMAGNAPWEELLDSPNHREKAGVVRAYGNWIARLAATCISIQKGHRTILISKSPVCSACVDGVFAADRKQEEQSPQICIL